MMQNNWATIMGCYCKLWPLFLLFELAYSIAHQKKIIFLNGYTRFESPIEKGKERTIFNPAQNKAVRRNSFFHLRQPWQGNKGASCFVVNPTDVTTSHINVLIILFSQFLFIPLNIKWFFSNIPSKSCMLQWLLSWFFLICWWKQFLLVLITLNSQLPWSLYLQRMHLA